MPKDQYHLVAPLPESLVTETNQLIDDIRTNGVTKKKREELYDTILKLTETGVDFFFSGTAEAYGRRAHAPEDGKHGHQQQYAQRDPHGHPQCREKKQTTGTSRASWNSWRKSSLSRRPARSPPCSHRSGEHGARPP